MAQTCTKCSRVNPDDASYCYYDGSVLGGHGVNGGPVNSGTQAFPIQFVFPSGKSCRNFDQLALAFQENWGEAAGLLQQGHIETFLGGLGRLDLALAAKEAAKFPDQDRGLDLLLAKLPSMVLESPKLLVEPTEVNLGQIPVGEDRQFELHLTNQGSRLLYGSVTCDDCVWLAVGEAPGGPQKVFQFGSECAIPIQVRGKHLRAGSKPVEARLAVESNGGNFLLTVRAEVPVKPFSEGVLTGAKSPRQVAEKAKAAPKDAAGFFEKGVIAKWYEENGWIYPVQGPPASGLGAVQQFFEALGLTPPPKVEISEKAVAFQGNPGDKLRHMLEIKSQEKRPVYAHGTSDQAWLEVGAARLNGRTAQIPLVIPAVPNKQGQTLQAKVTIISNGNQRFEVPVSVEIAFNFNFDAMAEAPSEETAPAPVPAAEAPAPSPVPAVAAAQATTASAPDLTQASAAAPSTETKSAPPPAKEAAKTIPVPPWLKIDKKQLLHLIPAGVLLLALLAVALWDLRKPPILPGEGVASSYWKITLDDNEPRIKVNYNKQMRFGIVMLKEKDPNDPTQFKKLTFKHDGETNNTCVIVDNFEYLYGKVPGSWFKDAKGKVYKDVPLGGDRKGSYSIWEFNPKVRIRQTVEIVPNEQTNLLDTCLIHYLIDNADDKPHKVGIRVMLDTFIGAEDGVPFAIPGQPGLLETEKTFTQKYIPDYVQALEHPDLKEPGTIAHLGLKLPDDVKIFANDPLLDMPLEFAICRWPETIGSEVKWKWEHKPMNQPPEQKDAPVKKDSCVVLYWPEVDMAPGEKRAMAFTYGLGRISESESGKLALTVGGPLQPGKVFTVTAYVQSPQKDQKVKLDLPAGIVLEQSDPPQNEEQAIAQGEKYSQVSWRVKAAAQGSFVLEAISGGQREHYKVQIRKAGLFD